MCGSPRCGRCSPTPSRRPGSTRCGRARLRGGQLSKARRGELKMGLPVGLVYDPAGKIALDPDVSLREAIAHLFAVFARTGSARAVVAEFNTAGLLFPVRVRKGAHKG